MIELLAPAFATCLLLAGVLGYFGLHVLLREVIFVDLALAQLAALGVAVAHMLASEASPATVYLWSFTTQLREICEVVSIGEPPWYLRPSGCRAQRTHSPTFAAEFSATSSKSAVRIR